MIMDVYELLKSETFAVRALCDLNRLFLECISSVKIKGTTVRYQR